MPADRYVLLGLAGVRTRWFGDVARWATSAALPLEFVKVVTVEEARARLRSGRPFSAVLVDAGMAALDRDLVELAAGLGAAVVAVDDGRAARSWADLGVHAVLRAGFGPGELRDALRAVARPIVHGDEQVTAGGPGDGGVAGIGAGAGGTAGWRGRLVVVCGSGGTGRSTVAAALASGMAADPRDRGVVLLADLALHAHQALLHDVGDVVPGLLELVDAHRGPPLPSSEVRSMCYVLPGRGYDLLLGLRRHRDWTALRPRAFEAALEGLRRAYRLVVADADADLEGDEQCGSTDVEDRNLPARHACAAAELVVAVGVPGLAGVHALLRVVRDLLEHGVDGHRIVPVVNRAPRSPRRRAELTSTLAALLAGGDPRATLASTPVFLPERRRLADEVRDGAPPPAPLVRPLAGAVRGLLDRAGEPPPAPRAGRQPVLVAPGSLGSWSDDGEPEA
ncbi:MAG TPA: hypothetical protein VFZ77_14650 [Acidimicrobiales bacterium]